METTLVALESAPQAALAVEPATAAPATCAINPPEARMTAPADRGQAIRELAYAFFEARGRTDGHDMEDWLKAETQIQQQAARERANLQ